MTKNHLKRLSAPRTWNINRHKNVFIIRPDSSGIPFKYGISLNDFIKDMVKVTSKTNDTITLLKNKEILINGKRTKDHRQLVGIMDIITFKNTNKSFRIVLSKKGKIDCVEIPEEQASKLQLRVMKKTSVKGGKSQVNLFGGRNLIIENGDFKTGDTLVINPVQKKVEEHLKFEKGMFAFLIAGHHIGDIGIIEDIHERNIIFKNENGESFETLKKYAYVIGKETNAIKIR